MNFRATVQEVYRELQRNDSTRRGLLGESGTSGLNVYSGYVSEAYLPELEWPTVQPIYDRIRRSDPEITIVRQAYSSLLPEVDVRFVSNGNSNKDRRAVEFGNQVLEEIQGGIKQWLQTAVSQVPFFGWGWWEEVLGRRERGWSKDGWRSRYDDGLIAVRKLAFRDTSSLSRWEIDDKTGELTGMIQHDPPNPEIVLPINRSVHLTFGGDRHNPEGLTPLESVYRLERYKRNLEMILGIGFEHAAGYLDVKVEDAEFDEAQIKAAARSVMTAQEGNYAAWPKGVTGSLEDVPFQAAKDLLDSIRYYSMLKLMVYNMQWVAIATIAKTGAFSAKQGDIGMFMTAFNSMVGGLIEQLDDQMGRRLYEVHNPGEFDIDERPHLEATKVEEDVALESLAQFWERIQGTMKFGEEDIKAIRKRSGVLPPRVPDEDERSRIPDGKEVEQTQTPDENKSSIRVASLVDSSWWIELQEDQRIDITKRAGEMADDLRDELHDVYLEWLSEAQERLRASESDQDIQDAVASLMVLLAGRLRARVERRVMEMAIEMDVNQRQIDAMRQQVEETLEVLFSRTLDDIRRRLLIVARRNRTARRLGVEVESTIKEELDEKAAHVALAGGTLWSAFQAGKLEDVPMMMLGRFVGPDDESTCGPCSTEVNRPPRPLSQIPIPGPAICLGLNNCRHDIEVFDPVLDSWISSPIRLRENVAV